MDGPFPTMFAEVEDQRCLSLSILGCFYATYNCNMSLNFVSYSDVAKET